MCICNTGVQSVQHVLLYCPLLVSIREKYDIVYVENDINCDGFLTEMEIVLGIRR